MDKFRQKLPKDELKKFGRDINKKLVASDYKNNRVDDPTSITAKQEKKIKKYVKDFFDRAVAKYSEHEKRKAERAARHAAKDMKDANQPTADPETETSRKNGIDGDDVVISEGEDTISPSSNTPERKRKREDDDEAQSMEQLTPSETPSAKRLKEDDADVPSPPPPPPPPPAEGAVDEGPMTEEERSMREQEEALMRENEEAQRLEDEAEEASKLRNDGNDGGDDAATMTARGSELAVSQLNEQRFMANGDLGDYSANGVGDDPDLDKSGHDADSSSLDHEKTRKQEILSH